MNKCQKIPSKEARASSFGILKGIKTGNASCNRKKLNNIKLKLIVIAGAFLYPKLEEKICIEAPHLFGKLGSVLLLKKSLYGLKQASHE